MAEKKPRAKRKLATSCNCDALILLGPISDLAADVSLMQGDIDDIKSTLDEVVEAVNELSKKG